MKDKDNGIYIGLIRGEVEGKKDGEFISGVGTEEGNHKDHKRFLHGKKNPALDDIEAGDPDNNKEK